MSSEEAQDGSARRRWRAPVVGAVAGLAVAAAIVGPSALADNGGGSAPPATTKPAGPPAPGGVPHQFIDAVAQLVQAGTIDAAQGRALDAQIETGRMDPDQMVARGVLTAAQMAAVNDRLVAVKKGLAAQVHPDAAALAAAAAAGKAAGKTAGAPAQINCAVAPAVRGKAAR